MMRSSYSVEEIFLWMSKLLIYSCDYGSIKEHNTNRITGDNDEA